MSIRITLSTHFAKFTMLGTFIQSSSINKQMVDEMFDFDALDLLDLDDFDGFVGNSVDWLDSLCGEESSSASSDVSLSSNGNRSQPVDADIDMTSVKKKRPRKFVTKPRVPRILNRDIRKAYGRMMTNVFNSSDASMVWACFAKHCRSDSFITHSTEKYSYGTDRNESFLHGKYELSPAKQSMKFQVHGSRCMAEFFIGNMLMVPDMVIQSFQSEVLHTKGGTTSKVRIFSTITGTRMFEIPIDVWMPSLRGSKSASSSSHPALAITEGDEDGQSVGSKRKSSASNVSSTSTHNTHASHSTQPDAPPWAVCPRYTDYQRDYLQGLMQARTPLATPVHTAFQSTCVLHLDENNCITDIEISRLSIS